MSDDTAPPASGDDKTGGAPTMGDLRSIIKEVVDDAIKPLRDAGGPAKTPSAPAPSGQAGPANDLDSVVDAALSKIQAGEAKRKKDEADAALHDRVGKLEKAREETKPVDRPRRSRVFGNIWDK